MTQTQRAPNASSAAPRRIPPFHAVPGRSRADGWTPLRQAEFIGELAETRSVAEAARRVGMTRETAYRLRQRKWSESFCAAWDAALGRPPLAFRPKFAGAGLMAARMEKLGLRGRALAMATPETPEPPKRPEPSGTAAARKVTLAELRWRYETGLWSVIMRRGRYAGVIRKADNSALLQVIALTGGNARRGRFKGGEGERSRV
uniref:hypothetical protein n=1 Tax=Parerythrobacter lutipelagi TaxID=1964208 RepID=UPI0010F51915|nr:hypothetical protein [Parerythrobacter lutipelagi]